MTLLLGIDGGGTKTLALLADQHGNLLGRGVSGSSNLNAVGFSVACAALEEAIRQAFASPVPEVFRAVLGLSGAGRPEDRLRFYAWAQTRYPGANIQILTDAEILLAAAAPQGAALALISGTGSIAYGRTLTGDLIRAGGRGYLFGDEGSGFALGAAALRAAAQAHDGRAQPTLLTDLLLARLQLQTPPQLIPNLYQAANPRVQIASLAEEVEKAAAAGDSAALAILRQASQDLADALQSLHRQIRPVGSIPLAYTGGVLLHGEILPALLRREVEQRQIQLDWKKEEEPAWGALILARSL